MLSGIQWRTKINQIKKFNKNTKDMLFFIVYHVDGDNKSPEVKIRNIYSPE